MKTNKQDLYVSGIHIERYERDRQWIPTAIAVMLLIAFCAVVYGVMSVMTSV